MLAALPRWVGRSLWGASVLFMLALPAPAAEDLPLPPVEQGPVLTLEEAVAAALEANPQVVVSRLKVEQGEAQVEAARSQMLPQVAVEGQVLKALSPIDFVIEQGALGTYRLIGPIPDVTRPVASISGTTVYKISVTQPLTTLVKLGLNTEVQEQALEADRFALTSQQSQTVLQVRQAWFELLQLRAGLEAARTAVLMQREMERVTGDDVAAGEALEADALSARAARMQQEAQALSLEVQLANGKEQLNLLMGRDPATPFRLAEPEPPPPPALEDAEALVAEALRNRPDLAEDEALLREAEAARALAEADWIPDVQAQLYYQRNSNPGILPAEYWILEFQAQYDLVDWGKRANDVRSQESQVEQARENVRATRDQVASQVRSQIRTIQSLTASLEAARASREAAEEGLRNAANGLAVGMALPRDVLEAQAQYSQALAQEVQARSDLAGGWAQLAQYLGRIR